MMNRGESNTSLVLSPKVRFSKSETEASAWFLLPIQFSDWARKEWSNIETMGTSTYWVRLLVHPAQYCLLWAAAGLQFPSAIATLANSHELWELQSNNLWKTPHWLPMVLLWQDHRQWKSCNITCYLNLSMRDITDWTRDSHYVLLPNYSLSSLTVRSYACLLRSHLIYELSIYKIPALLFALDPKRAHLQVYQLLRSQYQKKFQSSFQYIELPSLELKNWQEHRHKCHFFWWQGTWRRIGNHSSENSQALPNLANQTSVSTQKAQSSSIRKHLTAYHWQDTAIFKKYKTLIPSCHSYGLCYPFSTLNTPLPGRKSYLASVEHARLFIATADSNP